MNADLFLKIADHLEAHPEQHDQAQWCGAAQCIAGWAITFHPDADWVFDPPLPGVVADGHPDGALWRGERGNFSDTARQALDLDIDESVRLFEATARPTHGMTWPEALRAIAGGLPVSVLVQSILLADRPFGEYTRSRPHPALTRHGLAGHLSRMIRFPGEPEMPTSIDRQVLDEVSVDLPRRTR